MTSKTEAKFKIGDVVKYSCGNESWIAKVALVDNKYSKEQVLLEHVPKGFGWVFEEGCGFDTDTFDKGHYKVGVEYLYVYKHNIEVLPQYNTLLGELI